MKTNRLPNPLRLTQRYRGIHYFLSSKGVVLGEPKSHSANLARLWLTSNGQYLRPLKSHKLFRLVAPAQKFAQTPSPRLSPFSLSARDAAMFGQWPKKHPILPLPIGFSLFLCFPAARWLTAKKGSGSKISGRFRTPTGNHNTRGFRLTATPPQTRDWMFGPEHGSGPHGTHSPYVPNAQNSEARANDSRGAQPRGCRSLRSGLSPLPHSLSPGHRAGALPTLTNAN